MNSAQSFFTLLRDAIKGKEQDYTTLGLRKGIVLLAIPMILEMIMESLFAVVDIFFVGRLGKEALATVGATEAVLMIVYSVGMGLSMAGTALVARRFGEKNEKEAGSVAFQLIVTGGILAIVLGLGATLLAPEILRLMGAEETVILYGSNYTRIIFAGNIAILLLFLINGAFRGAGLPHLAMQTLWISNGINIVLDPLLIFGIGSWEGFGLEGAAIATTTGRGIGVLFQLYHLLGRKHSLRIVKENAVVKLSLIWKILKVSAGGMGQFLIDSASWIFLTRIIAEFGSIALAAYTVAFRVIVFTILPAWGLSGAAATLVGQNLGAGKPERAEKAVWLTARYNMVFLGLVSVLFLLFGSQVSSLFSDEPAVVEMASRGLQIITLGYVFFALGMVMIQAFNGAGDTRTPMLINILVLWIVEIPAAWLLAVKLGYGPTGIFITIAACHSLHALVSWWMFRQGKWKVVKV